MTNNDDHIIHAISVILISVIRKVNVHNTFRATDELTEQIALLSWVPPSEVKAYFIPAFHIGFHINYTKRRKRL